MSQRTGGSRIDWDAERERYVTGTEDLSTIARRLAIAKSTIEKIATNRTVNGGRTWVETRREHRLLKRIDVLRNRLAVKVLTHLVKVDPAAMTVRERLDLAELMVGVRVRYVAPKSHDPVAAKREPSEPEGHAHA